MVELSIDESKCIQCGECVADCPAKVLVMDDFPRMAAEGCFKCQHCLAICPTAALSIMGIDPDESMNLPAKTVEADALRLLIKGRRSVRRYAAEDVPGNIIDDLLETTWYAPTGVNAQQVLFTVVRERAVLDSLRKEIIAKLVALRESAGLPDGVMGKYMNWVLSAWEERGEDVVFRGAPHVLVATCQKDAPCATVDPLIALTTFDLYAQARGIGTLWDGIFRWVLQLFPELQARMGIPDDHVMGYAIAFGLPTVRYARTVQRGIPALNEVHL